MIKQFLKPSSVSSATSRRQSGVNRPLSSYHSTSLRKGHTVTTPPITLSQIENQTGHDFLGFVVNWRLMNIRVQEADLRKALERAGFINHMPTSPTPRKALRRALEAWIA